MRDCLQALWWGRRACRGMRAVPRLCIRLYPGIRLTTEGNHGKTSVGVAEKRPTADRWARFVWSTWSRFLIAILICSFFNMLSVGVWLLEMCAVKPERLSQSEMHCIWLLNGFRHCCVTIFNYVFCYRISRSCCNKTGMGCSSNHSIRN
jgi:hypothetical protein